MTRRVAPTWFFTGHLRKPGDYNITLEDLLARGGHPPEELPDAIDFFRNALTIDPAARWSAAQLLAHPWIQNAITAEVAA